MIIPGKTLSKLLAVGYSCIRYCGIRVFLLGILTKQQMCGRDYRMFAKVYRNGQFDKRVNNENILMDALIYRLDLSIFCRLLPSGDNVNVSPARNADTVISVSHSVQVEAAELGILVTQGLTKCFGIQV